MCRAAQEVKTRRANRNWGKRTQNFWSLIFGIFFTPTQFKVLKLYSVKFQNLKPIRTSLHQNCKNSHIICIFLLFNHTRCFLKDTMSLGLIHFFVTSWTFQWNVYTNFTPQQRWEIPSMAFPLNGIYCVSTTRSFCFNRLVWQRSEATPDTIKLK